MKISYNWLKKYVDTNVSAEEIANLLTFGGLEVEDIELVESIKGGLKNFFVGEVLTCENHPNSDHLHITKVNVGGEEPLNIVCGAPNVAAGQKVIVATIGAKIYEENGECFEIKKSKLRGEPSEGMICSEKELCLSDNHNGILVLDPSAKVGTPAKEYFNIEEDYVFEIGLTANRSDATSHIGVARDLVALLKSQLNEEKTLNIPSVEDFKVEETSQNIEINIDTNLCKRYSAVVVKGVEVKESPKWLADSLRAIGLRPVNNIVDVTNFILMEVGQPLHAFDFSKVEGNQINVKALEKDSIFVTLDGVERKLNGKEAMVCNSKEAMCMGGIYGGLDSGVNETTTDVLIESAYFDPVVIRKAAKYHGLKTDASFRYERGADPNITLYALKRAALLIKEVAGGKICSQIVDVYPEEIKPKEIELSFERMDSLIGKKLDREIVKEILNKLNISTICREDGLTAIVPTNKVDVTRECDLIEEILRVYGYNNIEISSSMKNCISTAAKPNPEKIQAFVSDMLAAKGFNETMNNSLTKVSYYENNKDFPQENSVLVLNALSKDLGQMRQTLLYGQLETISYNINRKTSDLRLFEFGNCYQKNIESFENPEITKRYTEHKHLAMLTTGKSIESWQAKRVDEDFYYLKNILLNIFSELRVNMTRFELQQIENESYLYALAYVAKDSKKTIATVGMLRPGLCKKWDIKQSIFYADIDWTLLYRYIPSK
ncbi:MAG: phenylalanine--tRNA ligase subunit beta, partial [Bacteroidales bacterium]|nr:phenylalanine--tRNA ligase subunit beta [Bacteroidales bacterium]